MTEVAAGLEAPSEPPEPAPAAEAAAAPQKLTAGALLRQAREAAGLSAADVANKLKFSLKQIESVEADNYAALGGKTFVRGLLRTYAKLLDCDAAPVLAALDGSTLPPETGQVAADPKGVPFPSATPPGNPVVRYAAISLVVVAVGILLLYMWHGEEFLGGPGAGAPVAKPQLARTEPVPVSAPTAINLNPTVVDMPPPAAPGSDKAVPADASRPGADRLPEKSADKSADKAADRAANRAAEKFSDKSAERMVPAPLAASGSARAAGRRILMSFERDSWVEVKDASGRVVFSQLNLAGTQQVIEGRAPFDLVIGNAGYVNLRYREQAVDLKPYIKADVARLNLN